MKNSDRLTTEYLGLQLANPFVPSASPMTRDNDMPKQLEDAGASAIVMHSLFEEELKNQHQQLDQFIHHQEIGHFEADSFLPHPNQIDSIKDARDNYLEILHNLKEQLNIPVIASLNGISMDGWVEHGLEIERTGADALELNIYYVAANATETAHQVEQRYINILKRLKDVVNLPITVKISSQHSAPAHFVSQLKENGANGVVLFNRFFVPDINLDTLDVEPQLHYSNSQDSLLRIRWLAIIKGQVEINLGVTGGIHTANDSIKAILAGADVTHMCSALLMHGAKHISQIKNDFIAWMDEKEVQSVKQIKGSLSQQYAIDPAAFERANYLEVINAYSRSVELTN